MKKYVPRHAKKGTFRPRFFLLVVCVGVMILCAYGIVCDFNAGRQGRNFYSALSSDVSSHVQRTTAGAAPSVSQSQPGSKGVVYDKSQAGTDTKEPVSDEGQKDTEHDHDETPAAGMPAVDSFVDATINSNGNVREGEDSASDEDRNGTQTTWMPYVDFEALREIYPDLVAWVKFEGLDIDYPVVHGTDNEYYLSHLSDRTANKLGSIFLDYRSGPDFTAKNSIIYGHNMKSGDMFGTLKRYKTQAFYDDYPTIAIYTPHKDYIVQLFAGYLADASKEILPPFFQDTASFERYIEEIQLRSLFGSDVNVAAADRLITLSTCTYEFSNARFVLVGKLIEEREGQIAK